MTTPSTLPDQPPSKKPAFVKLTKVYEFAIDLEKGNTLADLIASLQINKPDKIDLDDGLKLALELKDKDDIPLNRNEYEPESTLPISRNAVINIVSTPNDRFLIIEYAFPVPSDAAGSVTVWTELRDRVHDIIWQMQRQTGIRADDEQLFLVEREMKSWNSLLADKLPSPFQLLLKRNTLAIFMFQSKDHYMRLTGEISLGESLERFAKEQKEHIDSFRFQIPKANVSIFGQASSELFGSVALFEASAVAGTLEENGVLNYTRVHAYRLMPRRLLGDDTAISEEQAKRSKHR
jgi:hypothetical protein